MGGLLHGAEHAAPGDTVPMTQRVAAPKKSAIQAKTDLYHFGNPSAGEQLYLELVNRARANPAAEGIRLAGLTDPDIVGAYSFFSVDLNQMKAEMAALPSLPPLVPNEDLTSSARSHSAWMFANAIEAHDELPGQPGGDLFERITGTGYPWNALGENLYARAFSTEYAFAAFEVDWGVGTFGMLSPRGHRDNIHNVSIREIGLGVILGTHGTVGPEIVTMELGEQLSSPVFGTGVVYFDVNGNNFYDIGEGIPNVAVTSAESAYHCVTAGGGGWTLPFPRTAGLKTVAFQTTGLSQTASVPVAADLKNFKADIKLAYTPPVISFPANPVAGLPQSMTLSSMVGVTSYQVRSWSEAAALAENCESTANVTATVTAGYSLVNTTLKQQGGASFHLTHPDSALTDQIVELNGLYYGGSTPQISFQSRLRLASSDQKATVEVKEEGATEWTPIYTQAGTNAAGETAFNLRNVAVTSMSGKPFRARLRYSFVSGSYYASASDTVGWYVDAIQFNGITKLSNPASQVVNGTSLEFTPSGVGKTLVLVSPILAGYQLPAGSLSLTAISPSGFVAWAMAAETTAALPAGTLANQPNGDYDKDGRSNLFEYALGLAPAVPGDVQTRLPYANRVGDVLNFYYSKNTTLTDVIYRPEFNLEKQSVWRALGTLGNPLGVTDSVVSLEGVWENRKLSVPMGSAKYVLFRLAVQLN